MDVRRVGAPVAALVIGAVVAVLIGAADSPLAWATVVLVAVVVGVLAAFVTVPLTVARILVGVGVLLAVGAIVLVIVLAVRGYRSDTSTLVLCLAAGLGALVIVVGLLTATTRPLRAVEDRVAAGLAVLGLVAAALVVLAVPFAPQQRSVMVDQADQAPALVLRTPENVREGDLLVAQVYHRGGGALRAPDGWDRLLSAPVSPDASDSVDLFTSRSTGDAGAPTPFVTDAPGGKIGGVVAWSHVDSVAVSQQLGGAAAPIAGPAVEAGAQTPLLYFVTQPGATSLPSTGDLTEAWQTSADGVFTGSVALLVHGPQAAGTEDPVSFTPEPGALGPWAMQVLALQPD